MNAPIGLLAYVHLSFCLDSSMRQIAVSWSPVGSALTDGLGTTFRIVSKVQCVKMGLENPSALCLFYSNRDRICILRADLPKHVPKETKSTVCFAVLRHTVKDKEQLDKALTEFVSFEEIGLFLMYHNVSKTYRDGDKICNKTSSRLFQIDSQKKQDIAARLQSRSDQQLVFAGVYKYLLTDWLYEDNSPVEYANWAIGEPTIPTFAAVSKARYYKWVAIGDLEKAGWICQKPID